MDVRPDQNPIFETDLDSFPEDVIAGSHHQPILVDFWADWCAPCKTIEPVLKEVINELDGAVHLAKLEVDEGENMKLAGRYQVRGFPTIMLFHKGEILDRFASARPKGFILDFIQKNTGIG